MNPPTIEEMQNILFTIRTLEACVPITVWERMPFSSRVKLREAISDAKYVLRDAIERATA